MCLKKCWKAHFWPEHVFCSVPMGCALWWGHSLLPSSPLQQAGKARQTRLGVQSICLDKYGDLGPLQAMQGRVLIVCVPSNSPQSPGLSSHSIHPGLCLLSNLNLTHQTMENRFLVILLSSFFILLLHSVFWRISAQLNERVSHSGRMEGERMDGGKMLVPYTCTPWRRISWSCAETIWKSVWKQAVRLVRLSSTIQSPLCSPGMLIRGLGLEDGVESRACKRKAKACGEDEVHAGFTCTQTHTRRWADVCQDHTVACTKQTLSGAYQNTSTQWQKRDQLFLLLWL